MNNFLRPFPDSLISTAWHSHPESDCITYEHAGELFTIEADNLLELINEYAYNNHITLDMPYIHVTKLSKFNYKVWECYRTPSDEVVLQWLRESYTMFEVCDKEGEVVK